MTDQEKVKVLRDALEIIAVCGSATSPAMKGIASDALAETAGTINDELDAVFGEQSKPADIPFDLSRAQRGERVQTLFAGEWVDTHYVGPSSNGKNVFESNGEFFRQAGSLFMRMAPKKMRMMWIQPYIDYDSVMCSIPCDTAEEARNSIVAGDGSIDGEYLGDPIEIEVPDTRF